MDEKVFDKLQAGVEVITSKLTTLGEKYGPEVIDAGLWVVRINGVQTLAFAAAGVISAIVLLALFGRRVWRWGVNAWVDSEGLVIIPLGIFYVSCAMVIIGNTLTLLNIWHWVAIFEPKLWIAKRLLGL